MLQALPWDPRIPLLQLRTLGQARREIGAVRTSKNVLSLPLGFRFRGGVVLGAHWGWCWGVSVCGGPLWGTIDNREIPEGGESHKSQTQLGTI